MTAEPIQLTLSIRLNNAATYSNFCVIESLNHPEVTNFLQRHFCKDGGEEAFGYLWGGVGNGVSHLLQACCHKALESGLTAQYLPLSELHGYPAEHLLEGLDQLDIVCLDNIDIVAGNSDWEGAVFKLYNRLKEQGKQLLLSGNAPPRELGVELPDLESRFSWGPVFHLRSPSDDNKCQILTFRAKRLGISLPDEVTRYLLSRFDRSLPLLMEVLAELDKASLQRQRKITIPFVRELFKDNLN